MPPKPPKRKQGYRTKKRKDKERRRRKLEQETPQERERRLDLARRYRALVLASETPEQRERRLKKTRRYVAQKRKLTLKRALARKNASDITKSSTKKVCTFSNSVNSKSSQMSTTKPIYAKKSLPIPAKPMHTKISFPAKNEFYQYIENMHYVKNMQCTGMSVSDTNSFKQFSGKISLIPPSNVTSVVNFQPVPDKTVYAKKSFPARNEFYRDIHICHAKNMQYSCMKNGVSGQNSNVTSKQFSAENSSILPLPPPKVIFVVNYLPVSTKLVCAKKSFPSENEFYHGTDMCDSKNMQYTGTNVSNVTSFKQVSVENSLKDTTKNTFYVDYKNELYDVIHNMCYPKYLKNLMTDLICGIPFCDERFQTIHLYISHLRSVHDALNYTCPHCPEIRDSWEEFKNHLLCHGSELYACGTKDCEFYDCSKNKVKVHKTLHENADSTVIALREFAPGEEAELMSMNSDVEFPDAKDTFTCLFCRYKSKDHNIMKNHMYKEMAYQRFDCSFCEKKYSSRKEIREHFMASHPDVDILCSFDYNIKIETMVRYVLAQQQKFYSVKPIESCDICCQKFKNRLLLKSHIYICLQKEYRPYECHHCNENFVNLLALKYHTDEMHHPKCMEYSALFNSAVEEDIEKNLQKIRLKQMEDVFEECSPDIDINEKNFKVKFYNCSDCAFQAYHKYNFQRHNKLKHGGLAKVMKGREYNPNSGFTHSVQLDDNDSISDKSVVKRYTCGYCVKKMITIQEVNKHIRKAHTAKHTELFYYYTPNSSIHFFDKDIYECAYCKSLRENLFSLKKHSDLMHSEMEFKVKGFLSFTGSQNNYLACGYCYLKADSQSHLQSHSASAHPSLALKSIGDFQVNKSECSAKLDISLNKRVKFSSFVFVCSHCGGAFASMEAVTAHSQKIHRRFELKYTKIDQSANSSKLTDLKFYKCEFCKFTSEKHFLDKHLATKHKLRVTCLYCNKRFEFASMLKEHHDNFHKNLPIKYSQETVNLNAS